MECDPTDIIFPELVSDAPTDGPNPVRQNDLKKLQDMFKEDLQKMQDALKEDMKKMSDTLKESMKRLTDDIKGVNEDIKGVKEDIKEVKADVKALQRLTAVVCYHISCNFSPRIFHHRCLIAKLTMVHSYHTRRCVQEMGPCLQR